MKKYLLFTILTLAAVTSCKRELSLEDRSGRQIPLLGWYGLPLSGEIVNVVEEQRLDAGDILIFVLK